MPGIDLVLQAVADCEQLAIFGRQIADDRGETFPEGVGIDPRLGAGLRGNKIKQDGGDLQSVSWDTLHHRLSDRGSVVVFGQTANSKTAPLTAAENGCFSAKASRLGRAKQPVLPIKTMDDVATKWRGEQNPLSAVAKERKPLRRLAFPDGGHGADTATPSCNLAIQR